MTEDLVLPSIELCGVIEHHFFEHEHEHEHEDEHE